MADSETKKDLEKDEPVSQDQLDRLDSKAKYLNETLSKSNEKIGYVQESVNIITKSYRSLMNLCSTGDDVQPTLMSGNTIAHALERELDIVISQALPLSVKIDAILPTIASTSYSVATSCNSFYPNLPIVQVYPCPFLPDSNVDTCTCKLSSFDKSLADVYRGAWNVFYTQRPDPKRAALFQMRQVFDHLFDRLAPDDEVRQSPHWTKKPGDRANAIDREERIRFAAHRCITDTNQRILLLAMTQDMMRSYNRLNKAHERGFLSQESADDAFKAMDAIINRWIDASDPWPPK